MSTTPIAENSRATPGLWNSRFAELDSAISSVRTTLDFGYINVKAYGALGNGTTDDATALNAAVAACPAYGTVVFPYGTYVIGSPVTLSNHSLTLVGPAKILAKAATNFEYMLIGTGLRNVAVCSLEFDANKVNRVSGQNVRFNGAGFLASMDCSFVDCTARNTRGFGGTSAIGLVMASASTRGRIDGCRLEDCGDVGKDSDGVFTSGDQNLITDCLALRCTDTGFVLESSNYGVIAGCTALDCSAPAGITNATAVDKYGNMIVGLTGRSNLQGATGQIAIGVPTSDTGNLLETVVADVSLSLTSGTTGIGPAIYVRQNGAGRAIGVSLSNIRIESATAQGILIEADDISVLNCSVRSVGGACVQFATGCSRGYVANSYLVGGSFGIASIGTAQVMAMNNVCVNQSQYGIYSFNTSIITSYSNVIINPTIGYVGRDSGATLFHVGTTSGVGDLSLSSVRLNMNQNKLVSIRTQASLSSSNLDTDEIAFSLHGSGASLALRSGGTIWYFTSSASTKG